LDEICEALLLSFPGFHFDFNACEAALRQKRIRVLRWILMNNQMDPSFGGSSSFIKFLMIRDGFSLFPLYLSALKQNPQITISLATLEAIETKAKASLGFGTASISRITLVITKIKEHCTILIPDKESHLRS
jgi:hypothetical protein